MGRETVFSRSTVTSIIKSGLLRRRSHEHHRSTAWAYPSFSSLTATPTMAAELPVPVFTSLDQAMTDVQTATVQGYVSCPITVIFKLTRHVQGSGITSLWRNMRSGLGTSRPTSLVHPEESSTSLSALHTCLQTINNPDTPQASSESISTTSSLVLSPPQSSATSSLHAVRPCPPNLVQRRPLLLEVCGRKISTPSTTHSTLYPCSRSVARQQRRRQTRPARYTLSLPGTWTSIRAS